MSDRTNLTVTIHAIPDGQADAVKEVVTTYFSDHARIHDSFGEDPADRSLYNDDMLPVMFGENEMRVGTVEDLAAGLEELGVTFDAHEDPAYEYLGSLRRYSPERGRFEAECDADGNAVLTEHAIRTIAGAVSTDAEFFVKVLEAVDIPVTKRGLSWEIGQRR